MAVKETEMTRAAVLLVSVVPMRAYPDLSKEDLDAIVACMLSLKKK